MLLLQINELSSRGKTILSESKENKEIIMQIFNNYTKSIFSAQFN